MKQKDEYTKKELLLYGGGGKGGGAGLYPPSRFLSKFTAVHYSMFRSRMFGYHYGITKVLTLRQSVPRQLRSAVSCNRFV